MFCCLSSFLFLFLPNSLCICVFGSLVWLLLAKQSTTVRYNLRREEASKQTSMSATVSSSFPSSPSRAEPTCFLICFHSIQCAYVTWKRNIHLYDASSVHSTIQFPLLPVPFVRYLLVNRYFANATGANRWPATTACRCSLPLPPSQWLEYQWQQIQ